MADASCQSGRHVVSITGVPGAGKTLTGLQRIYTLISGDEAECGEEQGMEHWNLALQKVPGDWTVHCPLLDAEGRRTM
jgi:hypothetical protein